MYALNARVIPRQLFSALGFAGGGGIIGGGGASPQMVPPDTWRVVGDRMAAGGILGTGQAVSPGALNAVLGELVRLRQALSSITVVDAGGQLITAMQVVARSETAGLVSALRRR